jgi:hypothetical protein
VRRLLLVSEMKLDETMEMSYPKKYVEQIILGLEDPLNQHLIKLVAFDFPPEMRRHFQQEIETWLNRIQRLRMKPDRKTGPFKFYFDLLYDYPFGGMEVQNTRIIMELISRRYGGIQPTKSPEDMAHWLEVFHTTLAERLHNGEAVLDLVPE